MASRQHAALTHLAMFINFIDYLYFTDANKRKIICNFPIHSCYCYHSKKSITIVTISVNNAPNNRMGMARDLFKKIRDTKGTFHAKIGLIKDRNGMNLKKEKILRRGGKNTQKNCTKKIFMTQIITMV